MPRVLSGRLFLGTLGFHETFITSTLHYYGAGRGDGLLLVTLRPTVAGVKVALKNLEALAARLGIEMRGIIEIDPEGPLQSIGLLWRRLADLVQGEGYTLIVADLTGGPRIVVVSVLLALIIVSGRVPVRVRVQNETGGGGELDINLSAIRAALSGLGVKGQVLRLVAERPGITIRELAVELDISEKTAANYVSELSRQGLIARRGRRRGLYPTGLGRLIAGLE